MSRRSQQRVCVLNDKEAHAIERDGFLAICTNHRHWSPDRALREIRTGFARPARAKRIDAPDAVVMLEQKVKEQPYHWAPIGGVMQWVPGDIEGKRGKFKYPVPACGARTRTQRVSEINAETVRPEQISLGPVSEHNEAGNGRVEEAPCPICAHVIISSSPQKIAESTFCDRFQEYADRKTREE